MTTYILHGGATSDDHPENDAFFAEFTSIVNKNKVNILLCLWSRVEEEWDRILKRDSQKILAQTDKQVNIDIVHDLEDLDRKIDSCDVFYLAAGYQKPSEKYFPHIDSNKLRKQLKGKICIGSSMGAFYIVSNYILSLDSQRDDVVYPGLGLLPINCLCHWDAEEKKQMKLDLLQNRSPDLPILTLDEHKFVKFVF